MPSTLKKELFARLDQYTHLNRQSNLVRGCNRERVSPFL